MLERKGRGLVLDEKLAFNAWLESGTENRAVQSLIRQGIINPYTKKPYTASGIRAAAGRYILNEPDEARKVFIGLGAVGAKDDETWNKYLVAKALELWTTAKYKFIDWVQRMGFYTKYFDMFKVEFGLTENDRQSPPDFRKRRKINLF